MYLTRSREEQLEMKLTNLGIIFIFCFAIATNGDVFAGEVMVATETESCFYADGKMECSIGEFINTYYLDGDKIIRTNVFNIKKKDSIADNTVYAVLDKLSSDPRNNDGKIMPQIIRAIGFPGIDAVELLSIGKGHMQAVKSTSDYFVITRYKITKD